MASCMKAIKYNLHKGSTHILQEDSMYILHEGNHVHFAWK